MRVLHVMGRMRAGGTERQLVGMLRAAVDGHLWQPTLCVLRAEGPLTAEVSALGVPTIEFSHAHDGDPRRVRALANLAASGDFDVVHSSLWGANLFTRLSLVPSIHRPVVVVSERSVENFRSAPARSIDRALRPLTDRYIGNSPDVVDFICRAHGVARSRVSLVPNGIDTGVFHPCPHAAHRQQHGRALRIGCAGRLIPDKAFDVAIDALREIVSSFPAELVIAGDGPDRARLEERARGLPVHFTGHLAAPMDIADFLRTLDVFAMPSRYEGLSNAVLEARACGVRVVASAVPGMAAAVGPDDELVPPDAPGALAEKILAVAHRPRAEPPALPDFATVAAMHRDAFETARSGRRSALRGGAHATTSPHVLGTGWQSEIIERLYLAVAEQGFAVEESPLPRAALRRRRRLPDVVHVQWIDRFVTAPSIAVAFARAFPFLGALLAFRARRVPIVWTVHNLTAHELHDERWERLLQHVVLRLASAVHFPSEYAAAQVQAFHPSAGRKASVVPLPGYRPSGTEEVGRDVARARLALDPDSMVFLAFGGVRRYKALPRLLHAFGALASSRARLVVAGECKDRALAGELEKLAAADSRVMLRLDRQSSQETVELLAAADVVVLAYEEITNSAVAALALTHGKAIIATHVGSFPEVLATSHGLAGWLVAPDETAIRRAFEAAIHMTELERRRLDDAVAEAGSRVDLTHIAERMAHVYRDVVHQRTPRRYPSTRGAHA